MPHSDLQKAIFTVAIGTGSAFVAYAATGGKKPDVYVSGYGLFLLVEALYLTLADI